MSAGTDLSFKRFQPSCQPIKTTFREQLSHCMESLLKEGTYNRNTFDRRAVCWPRSTDTYLYIPARPDHKRFQWFDFQFSLTKIKLYLALLFQQVCPPVGLWWLCLQPCNYLIYRFCSIGRIGSYVPRLIYDSTARLEVTSPFFNPGNPTGWHPVMQKTNF